MFGNKRLFFLGPSCCFFVCLWGGGEEGGVRTYGSQTRSRLEESGACMVDSLMFNGINISGQISSRPHTVPSPQMVV